MDPRFFEILKARAPSVLPEGAPAYGFTVGVGWFPLLYDLVGKLEGWNQAHPDELAVATQIKEKLGGLRFYVERLRYDKDPGPNSPEALIGAAQRLSLTTCEDCGGEGEEVQVGTWWRTLCEPCHRKALWWRDERIKGTP